MTPVVSGFVLAGGRSSRMGQDKAALPLAGKSLLQRALETVAAICGNATILGSREKYAAFGPVIEDVYPDCGPLGGIHAALAQSGAGLNLILAVDTPFLTREFLEYLIGQAIQSRAIVTAPEIEGLVQPLCAVYSRAFLPIAEQALRAGQYKIAPLFPEGKTRKIEAAELAQFEFTAGMFENLNTPEDLARARARISKTQA